MARELSAVLDHVATIGELDLDDVAPTSHVVEVTGALRADEPRAVAAARGRARAGARRRATTASSSRARRHEREPTSLELSAAARPPSAIAAGSLSAAELFDAYRERAAADRAAGEEGLNCFTWVAEERPPAERRRAAPLGGVPLAVKDLFCTEGVPSQSGSRILEGYLPPYTATRRRAPARRRRAAARRRPTRTSSRWAPPTRTPPSARCATRGTATRVPGGSSGGSAAAVAAGPRAVGARHRHRRLDPPARRAVRDRRAETDLRLGLALRDDRLRLLARPGRPADARRARRGAAAAPHGRPATRCDATSLQFPQRDRAARAPSASTACASACPRS